MKGNGKDKLSIKQLFEVKDNVDFKRKGYMAKYPAVYQIYGKISDWLPDILKNIRQIIIYITKYSAGYQIYGKIFGRLPDIWQNIRPDTEYPVHPYFRYIYTLMVRRRWLTKKNIRMTRRHYTQKVVNISKISRRFQ